jgi:hypothetical protein
MTTFWLQKLSYLISCKLVRLNMGVEDAFESPRIAINELYEGTI